MLRRMWLSGGLGLALCLQAGCLYHATAPADEVPQPPQPVKVVEIPAARSAASLEPPPSPDKPDRVEIGPAGPAGPGPLGSLLPLPAVAEKKLPPDHPLVAALRGVLDRRPEDARKALERLPAPDRERLLAFLELTANVGEGEIGKLSPKKAEALLAHVSDVGRGLKERAPLQLRSVRYCRGIKGFGQYEPAGDAPSFRAAERVQVYAEVRHFRSTEQGGSHETRLSATLEVRGSGGEAVATVPLGACSDHSLSPRNDYFLNCQFHVPPGLAPGEYVLWLTVRDLGAGKPREAKSSLAFRVAG